MKTHKSVLSKNHYPMKAERNTNIILKDFSWGSSGRCPKNLIAFNEPKGTWVIVLGPRNQKFLKWERRDKSLSMPGDT